MEGGVHTAVIGGWHGAPGADKSQVHWFSIHATRTKHPWAYDKDNPQLHIASLELYGTLLMYRELVRFHADLAAHFSIALPIATDNRGNAYQVTNAKAKNDTAASMLMELAAAQYAHGLPICLSHVYREQNEWADQLTHDDFSGFDPAKRLEPDEDTWHILPELLAARRTKRNAKTKR